RAWSSDVCSSDLGLHRGAQLLLLHRLVERLADQQAHRLGTHLAAVALLDDLGRYLAGTEPLEPDVLPELAQARTDVRIEALGRHADRELAPEVAEVLNRNLHGHS